MIGADRNAVIQAIRAARTRAGLTQEAAAALTHHATSTISRWETGGLPNRWDDLIQYAHAMNQKIILEFGHDPDTTKAPPPEWARAMEQRLTEAILANREAVVQTLAEVTARYGVERALASQPHGEPPPDKQGPQRERAARR